MTLLSARALNRATLARQLLLERVDLPVLDVVAHLVGMQAQEPQDPYVALWSRIEGFDPGSLSQLLLDRAVVRVVVMRGTIHLLTADDCLALRPLFQPVLDAELVRHGEFGAPLRGVDLRPVLRFASKQLGARPMSGTQLRAVLGERFPDLDARALAYACRNHLCLVQTPPRGLWKRSAQVTSMTAEAWLGRPVTSKPSVDAMALRYFAAFGPATVADLRTWSRLTGLREVVERLRPQLVTFRDEAGRELFDLPDAPRPDPDAPAPVRFLPQYDNLLLSHADRSRFFEEKSLPIGTGSVLHDGHVCATWSIDKSSGEVAVHAPRPLPRRAAAAVGEEAARLGRFLAVP